MNTSKPSFSVAEGQAIRISVKGPYVISENQAVSYATAFLRDNNKRGWVFNRVQGESRNYVVTYVNFVR